MEATKTNIFSSLQNNINKFVLNFLLLHLLVSSLQNSFSLTVVMSLEHMNNAWNVYETWLRMFRTWKFVCAVERVRKMENACINKQNKISTRHNLIESFSQLYALVCFVLCSFYDVMSFSISSKLIYDAEHLSYPTLNHIHIRDCIARSKVAKNSVECEKVLQFSESLPLCAPSQLMSVASS